MLVSALTRARDYYRRQRAISAAAAVAARRTVKQAPGDVQALTRTIGTYQLASATLAARTMATEAGRTAVVDPFAFVGTNSSGLPLAGPVETLLDDLAAKMLDNAGLLVDDMLHRIDRMVSSEVTDAGRAASSVEIVFEPDWTNYVRVLDPPSCPRCAILAGRIYRDNEGFPRHPECDCQHWPVSSWEEAHDEGLLFSAESAFEKGQIRGLSNADTQAIREGADITRVVNAAQEMRTTSIFGRDGIKVTLASTTRRSEWRKANPASRRPIRLRPESIYDIAKDHEDALRLLDLYGYIRHSTAA